MNRSIFFTVPLLLFCCAEKKPEFEAKPISPNMVEAKGYIVPKDSLSEPKAIPVDESRLKEVPAGKPKIVEYSEREVLLKNREWWLPELPRFVYLAMWFPIAKNSQGIKQPLCSQTAQTDTRTSFQNEG